VTLGSNTVLTVQATNADGYQWLRNGVALEGQTNSSLALENVSAEDVGLYSCEVSKGMEIVPTRSATLQASEVTAAGQLVLYGLPVRSAGSQGTCPGAYAGYVNFTKTAAQGWGWAPTAGTSVHTASDGTRTDTKVIYTGRYSDSGCAQTTVAVPHPPPSPKYRFTIYFPNNVPTGAYPIVLNGFNP
jgi:hypothetical protein